MTIADLIKYVDFLKKRVQTLQQVISRIEAVQKSTRVVAVNADTKVEEVSAPTLAIKDVVSEFDATAKELRLAQTELEKMNHTTVVTFNPLY